MKLFNGIVSVLCLVGHVMCQDTLDSFDQLMDEARWYRSQLNRGSTGSRDVSRGGRGGTADFFNSNLQLDAAAPFRGRSTRGFGGSMATRGFGGSTASRGFGGAPSFGMQRGPQGIQEDPAFIRQILGSSITGREMRMGERGLPRHGGAGIGEEYADGRNNGWDGNPQTLTNQFQNSWSDPLQGRPMPRLPEGFNGDFGSISGMFGSMGVPSFRAPARFLYLKSESNKMKLFLQVALCFAFVYAVVGQGYGRRQRRPRVMRPAPIVKKPSYTTGGFDTIGDPFGNGLDSLRGGGMRGMPDHIKKILGSTVTGEAIVGGMAGFPRHGGTLNDNGIVNGWGADVNEPVIPAVDMWSDPLNGAAFPTDYSGQDLVFDPRLDRYVVRKSGSVGHQIAKESHVSAKSGGIIPGGVPHVSAKSGGSIHGGVPHVSAKSGGIIHGGVPHVSAKSGGIIHGGVPHVSAKSGGIIPGGVPSSHNTVKAEHNIVKEANHIARKTVGGVGGALSHLAVDPHTIGKQTHGVGAVVDHNIHKASGMPADMGFLNPGVPVSSQLGHDIAKSSGVVAADPFGIGIDPFGQVSHGAVKASSGRHIGISNLGTFNAGHVGFDAPEVIGHNVGKATLGTDAMVSHNIAKSSGSPVGIGFLNPGGPIASEMGHGIAKETGGVGMPHAGMFGKQTSDPVHNVNKIGQSGLAARGHDRLSASIGHGMAKQAVQDASFAIDMGSRGGLSAGDPIAIAATRGLARESLHVAGKTLGMATSGIVGTGKDRLGIAGGRHLGAGMDIFGQGAMVHPQPAKKPLPKFPTGYGRRRV